VLLRPAPDRRPTAEQLLTASKLEGEVKLYLSYVGGLKEREEGARARKASAGSLEQRERAASTESGYGTGRAGGEGGGAKEGELAPQQTEL
jgi:hypothetical protein